MKVFKVRMTGKWLLQFVREGFPKVEVVENNIPLDAELISVEYDKDTMSLDLYFLHPTFGKEVLEGMSLKAIAEVIAPIFRRI